MKEDASKRAIYEAARVSPGRRAITENHHGQQLCWLCRNWEVWWHCYREEISWFTPKPGIRPVRSLGNHA
jgi:hypothetical protein